MATATLDPKVVARLAGEAAALYPRLELLGVSIEGGSDYAEVILRVRGCRANEVCLITVGVFRDHQEAELLEELSARIGEHTSSHQ